MAAFGAQLYWMAWLPSGRAVLLLLGFIVAALVFRHRSRFWCFGAALRAQVAFYFSSDYQNEDGELVEDAIAVDEEYVGRASLQDSHDA